MDRFKDLSWFKTTKGRSITTIGNGGIGSWLNLLLARAGLLPVMIDDDVVDSSNISGQMFFKSQLAMAKVDATVELISEFGGSYDRAYIERFTKLSGKNKLNPLTVVGTDNMKSRKDSWMLWKSQYLGQFDSLFIDARLSAESFQIFCIDNVEDAKTYEDNYLYSDDEVEELSCTAKQTSHYAALIAGNIVRFVTNHIANEGGEARYIPFIYNINGILDDSITIVEEITETTQVQTKEVDVIAKEKEPANL